MSAERATEPPELDRLAERLQENFKTVVKRGYRTPDIESCREIARYLDALLDWPLAPGGVAFTPGDFFSAKRVALLPPDPEVAAVRKLGGDFLRALLHFVSKLDATLAAGRIPRAVKTRRDCDQLLTHLAQFLFFLQDDLPPTGEDCTAFHLSGQRVPDAIQIVELLARLAWSKADGIQKKRRSNEKTAPLCKFVTAALSEIGLHTTPATVASILQGRRHRDPFADTLFRIGNVITRSQTRV
jgi:hypothetical protein